MFGWLQDLIDGISSAISEAFSGIGQQISQTIWSTMMTWMYDTVYSAVADFFSMMGNMGAEIFDLKWVQATVYLFTLFGWGLFIAGVIVAVFDLAIEYQNGRGNVKNTMLNILKGFFACSLIGIVPIELYRFCITEDEAKLIKEMITEKIRDDYGQTPQEFCLSVTEDMGMGGIT